MKFIGTCSRIFAIGLTIAFVISAFTALILYNAQRHYLNPDTYKTILDEQGFYDRLPAIMAEQIAYSMTYNPCLENPEQCENDDRGDEESGGPPPYLKNLGTEDWEQLLSFILTPDWTKSQTESALDQLFAFLNSNEEQLTITISLEDLKANLTGQKGMEFIRILINAQPPCTETLLDLLLDSVAGEFTPEQLLMCRPPETIMDDLTPTMEAALDMVIDDIPNQVILGSRLFGGDENTLPTSSNQGHGINLRTFRAVMQFSPILPLIFLGCLTLFAVRSWKDLLFWWGIPFIALGLSVLVAGFFAPPLIRWGLDTFVINRIPGVLDPAFLELLVDSTRNLIQSFVKGIANQATIIAFSGITMTGMGLLSIYKSEKNPV
jgi:hypothetical protein